MSFGTRARGAESTRARYARAAGRPALTWDTCRTFELLNHVDTPAVYVDGLECTARDEEATELTGQSVVEACGLRFAFMARSA